jgi:hypothetical protein
MNRINFATLTGKVYQKSLKLKGKVMNFTIHVWDQENKNESRFTVAIWGDLIEKYEKRLKQCDTSIVSVYGEIRSKVILINGEEKRFSNIKAYDLQVIAPYSEVKEDLYKNSINKTYLLGKVIRNNTPLNNYFYLNVRKLLSKNNKGDTEIFDSIPIHCDSAFDEQLLNDHSLFMVEGKLVNKSNKQDISIAANNIKCVLK